MTKRTELKLEEEIEMLHAQLDVKEAMIKNYTAEIETQRRQLAIAKDFIFRCANDISGDWYINSAKCVLQKIKELEK